MNKRDFTRRDFIKGTIGAGIALSGVGLLSSSCSGNRFNSHGLPTTVLGKTGVTVPKIALGLGSRFCNIDDEEEALNLLEFALDNGLYYWDTAHIYENKKMVLSVKSVWVRLLKIVAMKYSFPPKLPVVILMRQ